MGTFHSDKGELHGITVVVDTTGADVWIGRCDEMDDQRVILLDADMHTDGANGKSKADYIAHAAKVGVWNKHPRVELPLSDVASVKRLGDLR